MLNILSSELQVFYGQFKYGIEISKDVVTVTIILNQALVKISL